MSEDYFTSDLHFGHINIQAYCPTRPQGTVEQMNEILIDNINAIVGPKDTVRCIGDFAMGHIKDNLPIVARLNGNWILHTGNHDRCWFGHGDKHEAWIAKYIDAGFADIVQGTTTFHGFDINHFPYTGDHTEGERYKEFRPVDNGRWLIHGHVHDLWTVEGRQINVGVDVHNYTPIHFDTIRELAR